MSMYPRVEYEMSDEDLKTLLDACKAVPALMLGRGTTGPSQQEIANAAWRKLGEK